MSFQCITEIFVKYFFNNKRNAYSRQENTMGCCRRYNLMHTQIKHAHWIYIQHSRGATRIIAITHPNIASIECYRKHKTQHAPLFSHTHTNHIYFTCTQQCTWHTQIRIPLSVHSLASLCTWIENQQTARRQNVKTQIYLNEVLSRSR